MTFLHPEPLTPSPPSSRNFKCPTCDKTFLKKDHLVRHESSHSSERPFTCPQCPKLFKRESHLKRHIQNAHSFRNLLCLQCGKTFAGPEQLRRHTKRHEEKIIKCDICNKPFSKKSRLELHKQKIHGPFPCSNCDAVFTSRREFKYHVKSEHFGESFPCPYCVQSFKLFRYRAAHIRRCHECFECSICMIRFTRDRRLRKHLFEKHGVEGMLKFSPKQRANSIGSEMESSDGFDSSSASGEHDCHCGMVFATRSNLSKHKMIVHSETPPEYSCTECSKTFRYKHVLKRHLDKVHAVSSLSEAD